MFKPEPGKGLDVFADADFIGNWDKNKMQDPDVARSQHGFIIKHDRCPVVWKSQLQQENCPLKHRE